MRIVSAVFHPLLMPTYLFGVFILFQPSLLRPYGENAYLWIWLVVHISTFIIPTIVIALLRITKNIPDFKLEQREDRILPFTAITIFYSITTYMFITKLHVGKKVAMMLIITSVLIGLLTAITRRYKISIHSAGMWGAVGFLSALSLMAFENKLVYPLAFSIMLAGLVNTARLHLNVHSPRQVFYGSILGFMLCFLGLLFLG